LVAVVACVNKVRVVAAKLRGEALGDFVVEFEVAVLKAPNFSA
jgi:hypothetical protein